MHKLIQSKDIFRKSFDSHPGIVGISTLLDGRYLEINQHFTDILEWSREEVIGKTSQELNIFDDYAAREEMFTLLKRDGKIQNYVVNLRTRSGLLRIGDFSAEIINIKGKQCLLAQIIDITERMHLEEELKANYTLLKMAGETAKFGGWSVKTTENRVIWSDEVAIIHGMPPGYSPSVEEGIHFYASEWRDKINRVFYDCVKNGVSFDEIMQIITASGNRVWVRTTGKAIRDNSGQIISVQGSFQDISNLKQTEEALRLSEERFRKIYGSAPIGIALVGKDFKFLHCNPSFSHFIGFTEHELLDLTFKDITHAEHIAGDMDSLKKLISGEITVYQTEKRYLRKDKQVIWGEAHISAIYDSEGNFHYFLAIVKDISERKAVEAGIQRINEELKELNAAKDKFFSIIAHDLRNPFNSILGFSELLKNEARNLDIASIERYSETIFSASQHTFNLLENLLTWAHIQRGKIDFNPRSIFLDQIIMQEFALSKNNASQKNIRLINEITKDYIVTADKIMLQTILRNLITNAIKFTPKNGQVQVNANYQDGADVISISDNGLGMAQETINQLFKIETNFTTRGTENEKGTGLGLLLCKEFIEKHGGKIQVESELHKGSRFFFTLPAVCRQLPNEK